MIRFHYGPWDDRYYRVLSYLEAKQLIEITVERNTYELKLTDLGNDLANRFIEDLSFSNIVEHMKQVKKVLGDKAGSTLKKLVYQLFNDEVAKRSLGEVIK
jgi:DNA-binding PadR family transcriptional regulator